MLWARRDIVAPTRIIAIKAKKNPGLKNCHILGCLRAAILSKFFWQLLLKRNFAFKPPRNRLATAASHGQFSSGFIASASTSRLLPLSSSTKPPIYHTRAARTLRLRPGAANSDDLSIELGKILDPLGCAQLFPD